jgi:hypothetical protein
MAMNSGSMATPGALANVATDIVFDVGWKGTHKGHQRLSHQDDPQCKSVYSHDPKESQPMKLVMSN